MEVTFVTIFNKRFDLEKELNISDEQKPIYAIYSDYGKTWRIQAGSLVFIIVPISSNSFESRKAFPESWRVFFLIKRE